MLHEKLKNKWWRITHLYKIKNKDGEIVTFKPNYVQLKHMAQRKNARRIKIVKARQHGITTEYAIEMLDEALWVPGMTCAIIAHDRETLTKIFAIIKRAYENLPDEIKPQTKTDTKNQYDFTFRYDGAPLDSSIYVALKLRGGTTQWLHISESAYVKDRQELIAGSKQTVPISGRISEETTGNGYDEFYDEYMREHGKVNKGELDYQTFFYAWFENPEYTLLGGIDTYKPDELRLKEMVKREYGFDLSDGQLLWRRWKMDELQRNQEGLGLSGEQLFKQEYPSTLHECFQSGAGNVFDMERVDQILTPDPMQAIEAPDDATSLQLEIINKAKPLLQKGVRIWELPKIGREYIIGVDPSDGTNAGDFSGIDVWDKENLDQVAQFYGKLRPDELAELAALIGMCYNEALIGPENNMLSTVLFLSKIYDNVYTFVKEDKVTKQRTKVLGWRTDSTTRDLMIDEFIVLFEEGKLGIRSAITVSQMKTFVKKESGKREHANGKSDDALFAAFIALQMRKYAGSRRTFTEKPEGF